MTGRIPYYWVNPKNGRAYWKPNKRMSARGFNCVSLGPAGEAAERRAQAWNERWQVSRKEDKTALGVRLDRSKPGASQFVYFLQIGERVKIGTSRKPLKRVQEIASGLHAPIQRLVIVVGTRADELQLHDRFSAYRTGGEWFVASRPVILTIGRCAAAGTVIHDRTENENAWRVESQSRNGKVPECLSH